ncbi:placenta-specific protein 9 [Ciconia maguari]
MLFLWALPFILLLQERDLLAAADPVSVLPGSLGRESWCNEHDTIHERLDIIEEKVIKTVEHLESEVKSLLSIISETTSNIPIAPGTPLIDIFDVTMQPRINSNIRPRDASIFFHDKQQHNFFWEKGPA